MKERIRCHLRWKRWWLGSSVVAATMLLLFPCIETNPCVFSFFFFFCFHSLGSFLSISILLLSYFFLFLCYFFLSLSVFFLFFFFSSFALLFLSFLPSSSALSTPVQSWHKGKVAKAAPVQPPQDHLRGISPLFSPRGKPRVRT